MKITTSWMVVFMIATTACNSNQINSEKEHIQQTMAGYFKAIAEGNFEQMKESVTSDYLLFESGKVWNNDSLWADIQNYKNEKIRFRLDQHRIIVEQNVAHVSYFNHAEVFQNDSLIAKLEWVESALLKKKNGRWRIAFLQSSLQPE